MSVDGWVRFTGRASRLGPGVLVSIIGAVAARFLSDHYGAPAMLMALLLGMAIHFLAEEGRCVDGIDFAATRILRFGVALLGTRISVELLIGLGSRLIALVAVGVILTTTLGLIGARLLGREWRLAVLTGGSVAICGASAAMAISAVLPKDTHSERNLIFTVLSVTVLSTIAMIAYPIMTQALALDERSAGVFLGGTIHDVAQVVGAGFSVSDQTGEMATLVKLFRVILLAPMVLAISLGVRAAGGSIAGDATRPPLIPGFVLAFLVLAAGNSIAIIPEWIAVAFVDLSRWALLVAIAAVGIKTSLRCILDVGGIAVLLVVSQTIFIAAFILFGIHYLT